MKVSQLGQFGLIDVIARMVEAERDDQAESWKRLICGVGDDCAVWQGNPARQLAKVDCQVQGVHFNPDIISWEDLGWKSLAISLSDIAAMGGIPRYALVSLGLPGDTEVDDVISLYRGMLQLAVSLGVAVAGGNVSRSPVVFVDVNVSGITGNPGGRFLSRSTACPGDVIAVTGWLGTAAAGLEMLVRKLDFALPVKSCLQKAFARPEPRLAEGRLFVEKGIRTGLDISDGLLSDLGHICRSSAVGAVVKIEHLPIKDEVKHAFGPKSFEFALSGGEDYQLLVTGGPAVIEEVIKASAYPVSIIGKIVSENAGRVIVLDEKGERFIPQETGWDHFKSAQRYAM
ncbi:MAG: thiamine-phosphate kinase [Dehalococcoidales bacterium]|nr:thiamine-phosphate kinase [Dehalococcoidales bacterium]